jgi:HKD family nuclease
MSCIQIMRRNMKIISTNAELEKQLQRLIQRYPKIAIATAWASAQTDVFRTLIDHKDNIVGAAIGTHFYQTHPDVLDEFVGSSKVKFVLQPCGVFHPKVYMFWSADAWEVFVGSPNLTAGALTKNSELSVLITSEDGQSRLKQKFIDVINGYVGDATTVKPEDAKRYRRLWEVKRRKLGEVADLFGDRPTSKPAIQSEVMTMDWKRYLAKVKEDKTHGFRERLALLKVIAGYFDLYDSFNDMPLPVRKGIAGLPNKAIDRWGWFGSMKGAMTFGGLINSEESAFSLALDEIPADGPITRAHYDAYIAKYLKPYRGKGKGKGKDGIATATRLLAMKRPDVFLCVDAMNRQRLAKDIGIIRAEKLNYDRYWDEVVMRIANAPWWQSPEPSNSTEKAVWLARAAMLDAIFYEHKKRKAA